MPTKEKFEENKKIIYTEEVRRLNEKADEIVSPMIESMKANRLPPGDSGVREINGIWVVQPHNQVAVPANKLSLKL